MRPRRWTHKRAPHALTLSRRAIDFSLFRVSALSQLTFFRSHLSQNEDPTSAFMSGGGTIFLVGAFISCVGSCGTQSVEVAAQNHRSFGAKSERKSANRHRRPSGIAGALRPGSDGRDGTGTGRTGFMNPDSMLSCDLSPRNLPDPVLSRVLVYFLAWNPSSVSSPFYLSLPL